MIKLLDVDSVKASTYNPRKADPKRHDIIEMSLRKLGFVLPIYADVNGEILSGHQRHYVAKRMGCTKIPVEIVKSMPLERRKSYNIVFNRATNDLRKSDTSKTVTDKLKSVNIDELAAKIPDIAVDTPEFYPCMNTKTVDVNILAKKNVDKMHDYARNMAGSLAQINVSMPIVIDNNNNVVNGIGRVQYAAETGKKTIQAVVLSDEKVEFSNLMLNYLSMDFDIHTRYADTLRYNSFRRARTNRQGGLGRGFFAGIFPSKDGRKLNPLTGKDLIEWKAKYGTSVVDFGAGHLSDTRILRNAGIDVAPFEPFFCNGDTISVDVSKDIASKFLEVVETGKPFDSVFVSSVFNSVPFMEDRKKIVTICSALCSDKTKFIIWTMTTNAQGNKLARGTDNLNAISSKNISFALDYEPNIILGDFSKLPKVQKFHSRTEMIELASSCFKTINRLDEIGNSWYLEASNPVINVESLKKALEFEFDLVYPDGSRLGMVEEAKKAFGKRLGIDLLS